MCYHSMNIRATSSYAPHFGFIPCGKCEECRDVQKSAWAFRLCAEIESVKAQGWKVGFCTLTYNDESLPILDKKFFIPGSATYLRDIPCFNKNHARNLILALRNWLFKEYLVKSCKYMIVTEYGSTTARPHMHLMLAWNPNGFRRKVDGSGHYIKVGRTFERERCVVTSESVHAWLKDYWKPFGFLLPENPQGGFRRKNGVLVEIKSFEVENAGIAAARYAAKYVCKDLSFTESLDWKDFVGSDDLTDEEVKELRDCSPFHIQSKSLGLSLIKNATPEQLLNLVESGYCFECETEYKQLPLYLRNKIFFNPKYCLDEIVDESTGEVTYKRVVRREATEFFDRYYNDIFEKRVCIYQDLINDCLRPDFWLSRCRSSLAAENCLKVVTENFNFVSMSPRYLSELYLAYYGVDYARCYDVDLSLQWYLRYTTVFDENGVDCGNRVDVDSFSLVEDYHFLDKVNAFWSGLFTTLSRTNGWKKHDYDLDQVYEFWNPKLAV